MSSVFIVYKQGVYMQGIMCVGSSFDNAVYQVNELYKQAKCNPPEWFGDFDGYHEMWICEHAVDSDKEISDTQWEYEPVENQMNKELK